MTGDERPAPRDDDRRWLTLAIELSHRCPPSATAFSVGAVVVDERGAEIARGFSRETGRCHAEEAALRKLAAAAGTDEPAGPDLAGPDLAGATIYSSLEPCARRASGARACAELIIAAGIRRVVIAWREPPVFVQDPGGVAALAAAGVTVVELADLAERAAAANAHLLGEP